MKVIVFGSTGGTGGELLKQGVANGHQITAFLRNPDKLEGIDMGRINIIVGNVLDPDSVENAVTGQDAVLSAIGAGAARSTLREEGTRNIVNSMQAKGIKRLVSLSSMGIGDSRANLGFMTRYFIVPVFLRHAFADHARQESVIRKSTLDWIIVRPPHLKDGPMTGVYLHGIEPTNKDIKGFISRADVADFMLKQLDGDAYLHRAVGISC